MNNRPLISVIVPVYNVSMYLETCVESILAQTYTNFELILVDDGSTDDSGSLCDAYAKKDNRVKVIHKKNGGQSQARNVGIDFCRGEYICFVDSDDSLTENALEILEEYAINENADYTLSTKVNFFTDKNKILSQSKVNNSYSLDRESALKEILCISRWAPWGHLYKKELFDNIRFPEGRIYEDFSTMPIIALYAKKTLFIDTVIYNYFQRADGTMGQNIKPVSIDMLYACMRLIDAFSLAKLSKKTLIDASSKALMELCSRVDISKNNELADKQFIQLSKKYMRKHAHLVMRSELLSFKLKMYYLMECFGCHKMIYMFNKTHK